MRSIVTLLLVAGAILGAPAAAAAAGTPADAGLVRVTLPAAGSAAETLALEFSLPAQAAAVDGRILFDTTAAEVVGVAPAGGGSALAPQQIDGGVAFGAYGLRARGGRTTLRVVIAPLAAGQLELRLVIDAAADASGRRLGLRRSSAVGTTRIDGALRRIGAPAEPTHFAPRRAAGTVRDLVADGALGKMDLDVVRAGWELAHLAASPCAGIDPAADANGDGCVDIVDIQAVLAGQGERSGRQLILTGDTTAVSAPQRGTTLAAVITPTPANTFIVNSTADTADANNSDGLCADSQGRCTLRAAITAANWMRGDNVIHFNLTGAVPVAISLSQNPMSLIQDRTGGLLIDGYSQPGSRVNNAEFGSNAIMGVELRGTQGSPRGNAFRITSANNTIRGLSFVRFYRTIVLDGTAARDNLIAGNWFGYTRSGAVDTDYRGNQGVRLDAGANHNQIGTAALADRNVIGNFTHAIDLYGPGTDFNVSHNNLMCITPSGNGTASCSTAVDHNFGPKHNETGGLGQREGNVIGRTTLNGVEISHGWNPDGADVDDTWHNDHNEVLGNWVGFRGNGAYDPDFRSAQNNPGSADNGNAINAYDGSNFNLIQGNYVASVWDGIQTMSPNSTGNIIRNNIIGESPRGEAAPVGRYGINIRNSSRSHFVEGNIIRNTGSHGIALTQKDVLWIRISRNIVTNTSAMAIFLAVNPNNSAQGANNLQPSPVISSATTARVRGTGQTGATVEVYRASLNAGQSGLPVEFIGSTVVPAGGLWELPASLAVGIRVTALQISSTNNTSRLSTNVTVTQDNTPPGVLAADAFERTSNDSWGQADTGGAWTVSGTAGNFDVGGGIGTMLLPAAGNTRSAMLNSVNARDVDVTFRVAADKVVNTGGFIVYAVTRRNTTNEYRARLVFNPNGTLSVNASRVVSGAETALGAPVVVAGLSQQPGRSFWLRVRVTGANPTTVQVKAWQAGQSEPAAWAFSATDSNANLQSAGSVGLRVWLGNQVNNAPVVFSFDDYAVRAVP